MLTRKITVTNDFHNTSATMRVRVAPIAHHVIITQAQWERAMRKLCNIKECCCGQLRGAQETPLEGREYAEYTLVVDQEVREKRKQAEQAFWSHQEAL